MNTFKVPPKKLIEIEFEDGSKATVRNPTSGEFDEMMEKVEAAKENGGGSSTKMFFDYVLKLGEGTPQPITLEQLKQMDNDQFLELLGYLNGPKKK